MKLTTKLLLGATMVAGLSISAFAACATDVDMGAKKLTNVADGIASGDAVNKGQLDALHSVVFDAAAGDGTNHSVDINSSTKITFTETVDNANNFDNSTFTVPENGIYLIGSNLEIKASSAGRWGISIRKNGATVHQAIAKVDGSNDFHNVSLARVLNLVAGDTIEVYSESVPAGAQYWSGVPNSSGDNGGMYGLLIKKM